MEILCIKSMGLKPQELQVSSSSSPLSGPGSADQAVSICSQSRDAEVRRWTCGTSCCSKPEGERTARHTTASRTNKHRHSLFLGSRMDMRFSFLLLLYIIALFAQWEYVETKSFSLEGKVRIVFLIYFFWLCVICIIITKHVSVFVSLKKIILAMKIYFKLWRRCREWCVHICMLLR